MLALPRNWASTTAHLVAQCSRRSRVGMAANIAPCVAHLLACVSRSSRVVLAVYSRSACARPALALRSTSRAYHATFSPRLRETRAIMLAYWRECDAIMTLMNRYPLYNGGATDPTASRHTHATRRPALDLELKETSS